jgi:hypothetical protein
MPIQNIKNWLDAVLHRIPATQKAEIRRENCGSRLALGKKQETLSKKMTEAKKGWGHG